MGMSRFYLACLIVLAEVTAGLVVFGWHGMFG